MPNTTLLYYTANRIDESFMWKVIERLRTSASGLPIVSVSQVPMDLGRNICIGNIGHSLQNVYKQVYKGLEVIDTPYVALVEDDCLYVPDHFRYKPNRIAYNLNRWQLHGDSDQIVYSYRKKPVLSQCIAPTAVLRQCLANRMKLAEVPKELSGEPGLFEAQLGLPIFPYEVFETHEPNVVICHRKNTSGRKYLGKDDKPRSELKPWGKAEELLKEITGITEARVLEKPLQVERKQKMKKSRAKQHSYWGNTIVDINELITNIWSYRDRRHGDERSKHRVETLPLFIEKIAKGEELTDEQLQDDLWYGGYYKFKKNHPNKVHKHAIEIMRDTIRLYKNILVEGIKAPLDGWIDNKNRVVIHRGWRRLFIMHYMHTHGIRQFPKVCIRLARSLELFRAYAPSVEVNFPESIHALAVKQFQELQHKATDKYWVHGYTKWYDRHFGHLRQEKLKILEIGVLRGASLLLWEEAFPKAKVYGIDKNTHVWQELLEGKKDIRVFVGQQEDKKWLAEVVVPEGPYDIVIDDGSHYPKQQLATFEALWPQIKPGGFFVIEDLHGNYWDKMKDQQGIMTNKIKELVDVVGNGMEIRSLTSYYNITFIEKL